MEMKRVISLALTLFFLFGAIAFAEDAGEAVLSFRSFDGGGHEYTVEIEDPSILSYTFQWDYGPNHDELEDGSPYDAIFTFAGLKPGATTVYVYGRSPILENDDAIYTATVDEHLNVTLEAQRRISTFFLYRDGENYYDTYSITHEPDGYHVSVNDTGEQRIDDATVDALMAVIDAYGLEAWDGFNESQRYVLDGETFWLEVRLTDGTFIQARGDNVYPENYGSAMHLFDGALNDAKLTPVDGSTSE